MSGTARIRTTTAVVLALLTLASLAIVTPPAPAATAPSSSVLIGLLKSQVKALPNGGIASGKRTNLLSAINTADDASSCSALRALASLRRTVRSTAPTGPIKTTRQKLALRRRLATLQTTSLMASQALLRASSTSDCGGGASQPNVSVPRTQVLKADGTGIQVKAQVPALRFLPEVGGDKPWARLALPNTDVPQAPGAAGIPMITRVIAVPEGAKVQVKVTDSTSYSVDAVDVFPAQPDPVDTASPVPNFKAGPYVNKPFELSSALYRKRTPASPVSVKFLGQARDLNLASIQIPAARFDGRSGKLKVLTSVDFSVAFVGGTGKFSPQLASPWESAQRRTAAQVLNAAAVKFIGNIVFRPCGEELLVITNPTTRAIADTYATARSAAGFLTTVKETGAGAGQIGTTATAIQTYIRSQVNHATCIRPTYITIIGDDELVPTFASGTPSGIPSDLPYSMKNNNDELPDVAIGRILGQDTAQLTNAITKILAYEATAPTGTFLTRAVVAAQFQDDNLDGTENRTFVQFAETVAKGLEGRGVTVNRVYEDSPTTTPLKFNDGTSLPASLKKPTFAWNGTGADVTAGWNDGRFMVVHRDHGYADGWSTPGYTTDDVNALTNSGVNLPVVLSINCSSAAYDYDEDSFTQSALVKPTGGAVGIFGDTRDSPTWHNSQLALGFVDALLPSVLPGEGPATRQRMGDALINGKLRLAGLAPPSGPGISGGDADTRAELYLWHYFGDPTMQMWGGGNPPIVFNPANFLALYKATAFPDPTPTPDPPPYFVQLALPKALKGQPVSLLRNGQVIGKVLAGDGVANIPAAFGDGSVKPGDLQVGFELDGAQPLVLPVGGVPKRAPKLTQTCPTGVTSDQQTGAFTIKVDGTLPEVPAGTTVKVTFSGKNANGQSIRTEVVDAKTNADGTWSATFTGARSDIGTWTASSAYAGDDKFEGSSAGPCTVPVT